MCTTLGIPSLIFILLQAVLTRFTIAINHQAASWTQSRDARDMASITPMPTPTVTPPTPVHDPALSKRLEPAATPILLADRMGLIMPDPYNTVYAGLTYTFGFVDPTPKPAPTVGGWLRQIQPLLVFPSYDVNIFSSTGGTDLSDEGSVPPGSDGLCGATVINYPIGYPFVFQRTGWYNFVINQTWNNSSCVLPILEQRSFFSWQSLSVAPSPTISPNPVAQIKTLYNLVVTSMPGQLPFERTRETGTQKLAIGLGIAGAVLALIGMGAVIYYAQRKAKMKRETLAFARLFERDKQEFLAENPDSWLNPNRQIRNDRGGPPAPPGTWAYENWYWQQMWNRQHQSWRWGRYNRAPPMAPQMTMVNGYPGYQGMYGYQSYQ